MAVKENKSADRIVRLDVNGFDGTLLERWKTKVSNKLIGLKIAERIMNLFNIRIDELMKSEKNELDEEKKLQEALFKKA